MTKRERQTLERYAKHTGPLPREEVVRIITQISEALQAAHSAGIAHRDLKPDNVLYDPESHQIELPDFDIAEALAPTPDHDLVRARFFVGTLMYVAPEVLSGELVTPAADQYSLATIAYFLLTGHLPYPAKTPREIFTQLLSQPPIPLNRARSNLQFGPEIEAVIMRGLAKEPHDRYPDVLTFATALRKAFLSGQP